MATRPGTSNVWARLGFVAVLTAGAAWLAFPLEEKIRLGLDLQGGTHLVLEVDLDQAVRGHADRAALGIRRELEDAGVQAQSVGPEPSGLGSLRVVGVGASQQEQAEGVLDRYEGAWDRSREGDDWILTMTSAQVQAVREGAARQVRETIGRRINEFGVGEQQISSSGDNGERIVLQLPGLDDVDRVKRIITKSSVLEFRLAHQNMSAGTKADLESLLGTVPPDVELLPAAPESKNPLNWYALKRGAINTGEDLLTSREDVNATGKPVITFEFGAEGATRFGDVTGRNVGNYLAIVIDGKVVQWATINEQIFARGEISGGYTMQEAADAALTLRSGALPAKVNVLFEQTVGPSLGKDSIRKGVRAALIGGIAVVAFMLLWYLGTGINAVVALALNMLYIMALLALMDATLTLPGVAGLVLTIGMAVDANIIIFERIKEELSMGRSVPTAIDNGFERAFSSILDGNVTMLIASFFLYNFGTGPIKGFAITLSLGLVTQMFTAVFVSRALFDLVLRYRPEARLSIAWRPWRAPNLPVMQNRHVFAVLSAAMLVAALAAWVTRGLNYGIDFRGGTQVVVKSAEGLTSENLRERLKGTEFEGVTLQQFGPAVDRSLLVRIHDAESAVGETEVNVGEDAAVTTNAAERLIALLASMDAEGRALDLSSAGRSTLADHLQQGVGLPAEEAKAAAAKIVAAREAAGGIMPAEAVAAIAGLPAGVAEWLAANAHASPFRAVSSESVGPAVGSELRRQALLACLWSLAGILAYVTLRFEFRFAVAAIVATGHDVLVTVGLLALLGQEIDTSVIAALLTILGYSLNDTIVVFDRIRENLRNMKGTGLVELINASINQTFTRTLLTSGLTLTACVALLFFGGPVLHGFALTMTFGVLIGTYSSIFVASPIVLLWDRLRGVRVQREAAA